MNVFTILATNMSYRQRQMAENVKKIVSTALPHIIHTNEFGLITVTAVEVSKDNTHATVYISTTEHDKEKQILAVLQKNIRKLQTLVNKKTYSKKVPQLHFSIDKGAKYSQKIEELLSHLEFPRIYD